MRIDQFKEFIINTLQHQIKKRKKKKYLLSFILINFHSAVFFFFLIITQTKHEQSMILKVN